ncbi:MAG: UvrD-helicase domain-containing protein [Bacteroidales bacterium]|nr:UvrD-helicase domain-containing protein [Bacteroidales bacterium]
MESFLAALNPTQREAVVNYRGPSLIIAGAGSGKTRVLTYRIAYLLQQGISPHNVLALTFTNKAANEMKERIGQLVGKEKAQRLWTGTFHAIFSRILHIEAEHLGFPPNFTIYDTTDSRSVIKSCIKELELDDKLYKPSVVLSRISMAKNNLVTSAAYQSNVQAQADDQAARRPRIGEIYQLYTKKCRLSGAMDFDDLLLYTNILLRDFTGVLDKYRQFFRYILVDEYQDTNYAQYLIVRRLAEPEHNICVVGDDAQSIYSFRGARIENILNFRKDYPDYAEYKLEQNYRSTQNIVNAANSVIEKNRRRLNKNCFSEAAVGDRIGLIKAFTDHEEAFMVADAIASKGHEDNVLYNEFAILYRTNAQSRVFEEALRRKNIPYKIYGGLSFYQRAEIKDMIAYLRLTTNPNDSEAFKRAIQTPSRGVGDTSMGYLEAAAVAREKSVYAVLQECSAEELGLRAPAFKKLCEFTRLLDELSAQQYQLNAYDFAMMVAQRSGLLQEYRSDNTPEGVARYENIEEFFNSIKEFTDEQAENIDRESELVTVHEYLENVALITDLDTDKPEDKHKVSLMTVHSAKGLEFSYVYVTGMEENLFPSALSLYSSEEIEEERRLFYVALTRAKRKVTVSLAHSRYSWGKPVNNPPSRFLNEMDSRYLEYPLQAREEDSCGDADDDYNDFRPSAGFRRKSATSASRMKPLQPRSSSPVLSKPPIPNFRPDDPGLIRERQSVEHERFGKGEVKSVEGVLPNAKAVVAFDDGPKTLLLKFARLRII